MLYFGLRGDRDRVDTDMSDPNDERLQAFLILVKTANWKAPPRCWNEEFRRALNESLVGIGFGGILHLTFSGEYFSKEGKNSA